MQRALQALFWLSAGIALLGASFASLPLPGDPSDKLKHALAFGMMASLAAVAYPRIALGKLWIGLSGFAALLELVQFLPVLQRSPDWIDLIIGIVASGSALAVMALGRLANPASP